MLSLLSQCQKGACGIGAEQIVPNLLPSRKARFFSVFQLCDGGHNHRGCRIVRTVHAKNSRPDVANSHLLTHHTAHLSRAELCHAVSIFGKRGRRCPKLPFHTSVFRLRARADKGMAPQALGKLHRIQRIAYVAILHDHVVAGSPRGSLPRKVEKHIIRFLLRHVQRCQIRQGAVHLFDQGMIGNVRTSGRFGAAQNHSRNLPLDQFLHQCHSD